MIFKNVNEKRKLKIIKDNKNLQNMININILNYELYSKKTIKFTGKKVKEKVKNIIKMVNYYLKENINVEKEKEKVKNLVKMEK